MAEFLGSARGRLLAVFDSADAAATAAAAIGDLGVAEDRIEAFTGDEGAAAFDGSGRSHGLFGRLYRAIQFTLVDQAPDFAYYEAAARQDRVVLSVRPGGEKQMRAVVDVVRRNGGHFINYFGAWATEEFERWHGPEPDLPGFMRR
ncbi:MAG TPA: hypothetical protein VFV72_02950 [Candidatus Limnocylindrales bacterium]|nr:hypothetical protein [Candidatus Limnocylindrales bacterium]